MRSYTFGYLQGKQFGRATIRADSMEDATAMLLKDKPQISEVISVVRTG